MVFKRMTSALHDVCLSLHRIPFPKRIKWEVVRPTISLVNGPELSTSNKPCNEYQCQIPYIFLSLLLRRVPLFFKTLPLILKWTSLFLHTSLPLMYAFEDFPLKICQAKSLKSSCSWRFTSYYTDPVAMNDH